VIDMADTETKKDEVTGEERVFNQKTGEYVPRTMSTNLYRQQKAAQTRQALLAGTAGLAAEAVQYGIGASIFGDPAIKDQGTEKARLAAELRKGPDYQTEAEKRDRMDAALAPAERKAEAVQKRMEKIAASTGDFSARNFLAAGDAGVKQIAQQSREVGADIAAEDVRRQQVKADQDIQTRKGIEEIDAMMLELRNKYIREPLHKFISDAGKLAGTLMAYAPGKTIDEQVEKLRAADFDEKEISSFVKTFEGRPRAARKAADQLAGKRSPNVVDTTGDTGKTPEEEKADAPVRPTTWKDPALPGATWHGVEYTLQNDGNIVYFDPVRKNKRGEPLRLMVRPGSDSYTAIMKYQPESGGQAEGQIARPEGAPTTQEFEAAKEAERLKGMTPEQIEAEETQAAKNERWPTYEKYIEDLEAERIKGMTTALHKNFKPLPDNKFKHSNTDNIIQWNEADKSWIILDENGEPTSDAPLTLDMMKDSKPPAAGEDPSRGYLFYTLAKEAGLLEEGTSA